MIKRNKFDTLSTEFAVWALVGCNGWNETGVAFVLSIPVERVFEILEKYA